MRRRRERGPRCGTRALRKGIEVVAHGEGGTPASPSDRLIGALAQTLCSNPDACAAICSGWVRTAGQHRNIIIECCANARPGQNVSTDLRTAHLLQEARADGLPLREHACIGPGTLNDDGHPYGVLEQDIGAVSVRLLHACGRLRWVVPCRAADEVGAANSTRPRECRTKAAMARTKDGPHSLRIELSEGHQQLAQCQQTIAKE